VNKTDMVKKEKKSIKARSASKSIILWQEIFDQIQSNDIELGNDLTFKYRLNKDLIKPFLKALQSNTTLKHIDLSGNEINDENISSFATILQSNNSLETVFLNRNKFSIIGMEKLVDALKINKSIKKLVLSGNKNILNENNAKKLVESLKINKTLKELDLTGCQISSEIMFYISEILKTNHSLTKLIISLNKDLSEIEHLPNALQNNSTLKVLEMGFLQFSKQSEMFSNALKINNHLIEINLRCCELKENDIYFIAEALKINKTLKKLYICYNWFSLKAIDYIANALKINNTLNFIDLSGFDILKQHINELANTLKINKTLKQIMLKSNKIGDEGMELLSQAFMINNTVTHIDLNKVECGVKGALFFAEMLKINKGLLNVDLSENNLNEGVVCIAEALSTNDTLQNINLYHVNADFKSALEIAKMLKINKSLLVLNLGGNYFMKNGCMEIAKALEINQTLININFAKCMIKSNQFDAFVKMLKINKCLQVVNLRDSEPINNSNINEIIEILTMNPNLKELHFSDYKQPLIDDHWIELLIDTLKNHKSILHFHFMFQVSNEMIEKFISLLKQKKLLRVGSHLVYESHVLHFYNERNERNRKQMEWSRISNRIIDICIALHSFNLPPYVLLEIIDWLPLYECIEHKKKIDLIINLKKSISKILNVKQTQ